VRDLPQFLRPGDVMVLNDTRVIPAQLSAHRLREGISPLPVSLTLHQRLAADRWAAFAKPGRRLKAGDRLVIHAKGPAAEGPLSAAIEMKEADGSVILRFDRHGPALDAAIAAHGALPLPPYIAERRPVDAADTASYQTIYAQEPGAVAAPTAGLHFTPELLTACAAAGAGLLFVTLHVGAGTFLPVKTENVAEHRMHAEWGRIHEGTAAFINDAKANGGRIIAVGTTALRLLESAAEPDGTIRPFASDTQMFITPGYRFRAVDMLLTNFHLPKSTLFMLVSAFAGLDTMRAAYAHAIGGGYRFYSYGDASLLHRQDAVP
jgi:S-adenosylmethionine:tRNA ribosyltransferase-isomerase